MARELTYKDLCDILATKCSVSESTVSRFIEYFILMIASELQNHSSINIKNLGKFSVEIKGGKDEWLQDEFGKIRKQYVEPFKYIDFEPSKNLLNVINGESLSCLFDKKILKYDKPVAYEDILNDKMSYDLSEDIKKILATKKTKEPIKEIKPYYQFDKVNKQRQKRILCKTNNVIYPSIYRASVDLGLDYRTLKRHCSNNGDMQYNGYEFKLLEKEREEDNNGKV